MSYLSLSQVIGNAAALMQSEDWAALIADAKERGCFVTMNSSHVKNLLASQNINRALPSTKDSGLLGVSKQASQMKNINETKRPFEKLNNNSKDANSSL